MASTTNKKKLSLIQSQKESFTLDLRYENGNPFNLQNTTQIIVCFPGEADDTFVHVDLIAGEVQILNSCAGKILISISGTKMALVRPGEDMDWEIKIIKDNDEDDPFIVQFRESLTVSARICPD